MRCAIRTNELHSRACLSLVENKTACMPNSDVYEPEDGALRILEIADHV